MNDVREMIGKVRLAARIVEEAHLIAQDVWTDKEMMLAPSQAVELRNLVRGIYSRMKDLGAISGSFLELADQREAAIAADIHRSE